MNELIDETRVESLLEKVEVVQDVDSYQRYTCKYIADQSRQHFILDSAATVKTKVKTDSCRQPEQYTSYKQNACGAAFHYGLL